MKSNENVSIFFKNAKVKWAIVQEPDENNNWRVDIYPNADEIKTLESHGVEIKKDDEGKPYVGSKRKTQSNAGKTITAPVVVDAANLPYEGLIGNGSVCNVAVSLYNWEYMGKKGTALWLTAIQVVKLESYNASPFQAVGEAIPTKAEEGDSQFTPVGDPF